MSKYHKLAWNDEAKQKAREEIHKHKPWLKSTGAKTKEGKEKSKMNALKNDLVLHGLMKELDILLRKQKELNSIIKNNNFYKYIN